MNSTTKAILFIGGLLTIGLMWYICLGFQHTASHLSWLVDNSDLKDPWHTFVGERSVFVIFPLSLASVGNIIYLCHLTWHDKWQRESHMSKVTIGEFSNYEYPTIITAILRLLAFAWTCAIDCALIYVAISVWGGVFPFFIIYAIARGVFGGIGLDDRKCYTITGVGYMLWQLTESISIRNATIYNFKRTLGNYLNNVKSEKYAYINSANPQ